MKGLLRNIKRICTVAFAAALPLLAAAAPPKAAPRCLTECTPRIGIVSAFGAEADLLVEQTHGARTYTINGNRFTLGTLRGNRVVIVLSGVSMVNSAMVTQLLIDHFRVERLVMSGIAGGVNPMHHVGDVIVPERWSMPLEIYWSADSGTPAPCGTPGDVQCLGLKLASGESGPLPPFELASSGVPVPTGLFMRETFVRNAINGPDGEFRFDYPADPAMVEVARRIEPELTRCGPRPPQRCVSTQPRVFVGGRGVSGPAFLANPQYRNYLFEVLQAQAFEMETAALAHVAYANRIPYIAFRSLSDLAGASEFNEDVGALFSSGLAEANEAAVTLAFLEAWRKR
ncbi:MAG TPA: 5'-methylthioadenosine/S-adenosylhomocysteine nucleosidase [Burkholderiaceae bacterium]|nr:5'-methylthioadenosine/S-adenosylhomocysteine nucleosidase [Burkholderiaceae bacterium]